MDASLRIVADLLLQLNDILYEESDASSENNHEDDFTGSDNNFLGFYDE